jgi:hypothetical protein
MQAEVAIDEHQRGRCALQTPSETRSREAKKKAARLIWNVRAVGFISKPERVRELAECTEGPLAQLLNQVPGFVGVMTFNSHKEWRSMLVLTFWETEGQATKNRWEEFSAVRSLVSPLIDACTKVQTFETVLPHFLGRDEDRASTGAG